MKNNKLGENMFNFIKNFGRTLISKCFLCNRKIYESDLYGYDADEYGMSLCGVYFCIKCMSVKSSTPIDELKLGETCTIDVGANDYHPKVSKGLERSIKIVQ